MIRFLYTVIIVIIELEFTVKIILYTFLVYYVLKLPL